MRNFCGAPYTETIEAYLESRKSPHAPSGDREKGDGEFGRVGGGCREQESPSNGLWVGVMGGNGNEREKKVR